MPLEVRLWRTVGTPRVVDAREVPPPAQAPAEASVSADLLRHPLSRKARQMLQKAQRAAEAGDHAGAIRQFEETLAKYPDSGAWTYSWLGVEYIKTDQFDAAVTSFEQAVLLLPHDAVSRSNFGLSLATTGQYDRAERELRRALELDRTSFKTRELLDVLLDAKLHDRPLRNPN